MGRRSSSARRLNVGRCGTVVVRIASPGCVSRPLPVHAESGNVPSFNVSFAHGSGDFPGRGGTPPYPSDHTFVLSFRVFRRDMSVRLSETPSCEGPLGAYDFCDRTGRELPRFASIQDAGLNERL